MVRNPYARQYQQYQVASAVSSEEALALAYERCRQLTVTAQAAIQRGKLDEASAAVGKVQDTLMGLSSILDFTGDGHPPERAAEIVRFSQTMAALYDWWVLQLTEALTGRKQVARGEFQDLTMDERMKRLQDLAAEFQEFEDAWRTAAAQKAQQGRALR